MTIHVFTSFKDIPAQARHRLSYPNEGSFFLSLDWFELLFDTCMRSSHTPRIYLELGPDEDVLCAMFCAVATKARRTLVSLTNFYSLTYLPGFAQTGRDQAALHALSKYIAQERPRWDALRFAMLPDGQEASAFTGGFQQQGFSTQRFFQYENWYASVSGESFGSYFAKRPSQLRNTIIRKQKKLEKLHKVDLRFARAESAGLHELVRDFIVIYGASWKEPEPFPDFIPTLVARCALLGILRLGVLYIDGQPAAAQLWITAGRKSTIYKLAYDEKFGHLGVGSILSRELFCQALDEDHVEEIDYGVGSEAYKKEWMTSVRQIRGMAAFNSRSAKGFLLGAWESAKATVKRCRATPKSAEHCA